MLRKRNLLWAALAAIVVIGLLAPLWAPATHTAEAAGPCYFANRQRVCPTSLRTENYDYLMGLDDTGQIIQSWRASPNGRTQTDAYDARITSFAVFGKANGISQASSPNWGGTR